MKLKREKMDAEVVEILGEFEDYQVFDGLAIKPFIKYNAKSTRQLNAWLNHSVVCGCCGLYTPSGIRWHHTDPLARFHKAMFKEHSPSDLVSGGKTQLFIVEVKKTIPLCGTCHTIFHRLLEEGKIEYGKRVFVREDLYTRVGDRWVERW